MKAAALLSLMTAGAFVALAVACGEGVVPEPLAAAAVADAAPRDALEDGDDDGGDGAVAPKGARTLGIAVRIDALDFPDQVQAIREAGASSTNVSFAWDDLEREVDGGDPVLHHPGVHVAGLILSSARTKAALAVEAIDATGTRAPPDLASLPLDDAEVAARYDEATDYVLSQLPDLETTAYLVASDLDVALGNDAARYAAFATFFDRVAGHARAARPGMRVGVAVTSEGLASKRDLLAGVLGAVDVIAVSHVGALPADLGPIALAAPTGKALLLHAVGHPSAPDEAAQAAFVSAIFAAWDRHADRIPELTFFELDDPPGGATTFGLRRYADGRGKAAFGVLTAETRARGF